jgi:cytidine deaminase
MSETLDGQLAELVEKARQARGFAYAPYSQFCVGAAVLAGSGKVYTGCNIENASYGLTVCAERVAILRAASEGERVVVALAVVADDEDLARPCGACLQVIAEFGNPDSSPVIVTSNLAGVSETRTLAEYLPIPFEL